MALGPTQEKTGHLDEESGPVGGKRGGGDGSEGAQQVTGYDTEDSGPVGGTKGADGLVETQGKTGYSTAESMPSRDWPSGRLDEIKEL
jgi:hypothetical protein